MNDPGDSRPKLPLPVSLPDESAPVLRRASRELLERTDAEQVVPRAGFEAPWSAAARTRAAARDAALAVRLDLFRDDLHAIRLANQVLNRAAAMRAVEAAEAAIFEIHARGEAFRLSLVNRAQLEMTSEFLAQLEALDRFRERCPEPILDALKERALAEFTARLNAASASPPMFPREEILSLRKDKA
jgi:hypothetical protein